ncbi:MAG: hypothetical protein A3F84_15600 [Candidatus Handelsmanbacteria bacterium RIFCSPLOWO2_12_FULL_64_10]|uniref:FlgD/Vpr Ig-like domain-containing protein n=1 Tax=Handelsmanbacteria sp. (strain RIFCSPLOWO2_12_FULL_64_10) TaxID=1817868 RepID=A0A1F6C3C9_HANXR|nr:MAG: hypothetical protein A3F84_15600 [Candidatus Handelsmanbacteria bacterium RIFCSPLOWO2_12_FULL_64_10]
MKRCICFLLALGILSGIVPTAAFSLLGGPLTATPVFWPNFIFVDPAGNNPNSTALFQLTGLKLLKPVTVTMRLTKNGQVISELIDGDPALVFTPLFTEGVVMVVRTLPNGTATGTYTETVKVTQDGKTVTLSRSTVVKSLKDPDTAILEIRLNSGASKPVASPFAYTRSSALAEGSDISSNTVDGLSVLRLFTLANHPLKVWVSVSLISEFTPWPAIHLDEFIKEFFKKIFKGILPPGTTVIDLGGTILSSLSGAGPDQISSTDLSLNSPTPSPNPQYGFGSLAVSFDVSEGSSSPKFASGRIAKPVSPGFEYVHLTVYNLLGQRVKVLIDGERPAGRYTATWDGRDEGGRYVANGVYFYRLRVGVRNSVGKGLILR